MHKGKLISVCRLLTHSEMRQLCLFVQSPFHNRDPLVRKLVEYLFSLSPKYTDHALNRKIIFSQLFPGDPYDEKRLSYIVSATLKLMEDFLFIREKKKDAFDKTLALLRFYSRNKLDKHFHSVEQKARKLSEKMDWPDAGYFYNLYRLNEVLNERFEQTRKRVYDESLQSLMDHLDRFYVLNKLKYSCEMINRKAAVSGEYEMRLLDEILSLAQRDPALDYPSLTAYYHVLQMLKDPDKVDAFKSLRQLLQQYAARFPVQEARDLYTYALNYCIIQINKGETGYLETVFALYREMLEKKIIFIDGEISPWSFKNIVSVALRLEQLEWAESFVSRYIRYLAPTFRPNAYAYNMASIMYRRQQYKKALLLLQQVRFTDIYYSLDTRSLLLKIYYELNEREALLNHLETFRVYLIRNKLISDNMRRVYQNQVRWLRRLLRTRSVEKTKWLLSELEQTGQVADKSWLLAKFREQCLEQAVQ